MLSITSWIAKRQTKEIIKGIIQAVRELIAGLLSSWNVTYTEKRKDTTTINHVPIIVDNKYPTKYELEMKKAQDILRGNK